MQLLPRFLHIFVQLLLNFARKIHKLVELTSMFCEQKPGVDLDPLEMNLVAQSASLSIADQQLMLSLPILLDISEMSRRCWLWQVFRESTARHGVCQILKK